MLQQSIVFLAIIALSTVMLTGCKDADTPAAAGPDVITSEQIDNSSNDANISYKGVLSETTDVFGQSPDGPVVAEDEATLRRTSKGISIKLKMPTPEPGQYEYPAEGGAFSGPGPDIWWLALFGAEEE